MSKQNKTSIVGERIPVIKTDMEQIMIIVSRYTNILCDYLDDDEQDEFNKWLEEADNSYAFISFMGGHPINIFDDEITRELAIINKIEGMLGELPHSSNRH